MTARNSPCPCGSGRKFKHCHGRAAAATPAASPQQRLDEARQHARAGRFDAALADAANLPPGPPRSELTVQVLLARRADGDLAQAGRELARWAKQVPGHPEPWYRRIEWALLKGDHEAARAACEEAGRRAPNAPHTLYFSALIAQLDGRLEDALSAYREAISAQSRVSLAPEALALEAAIQALETAAGEYPGAPPGLETALVDRVAEREHLRAALRRWSAQRESAPLANEQRTRYANAWYNLGCSAMADFGRVDEALESFQAALDIDPDHELARLNHAFMLNYSDQHDADAVAKVHREAGRWLRKRHGAPGQHFANDPDPERPLRVGYLSSDFRAHSVAHFILPVLDAHDRAQVRTFVYHAEPRRDGVTERVAHAAGQFRHVAGMDDDALWRQIRADRVDILVDLNGLTRGHRVGVLARRAAPLQGHWIGYPNTTGLDSMDFRIVDAVTDPPGGADRRSSETLIRLDGPFSVYEAPARLPDPATESPHRAAGYFTYGCFNHLPKLSPTLLATWADILRQVPDSRLLIKSMMLDYEQPRARLAAALQALGVEPDRFELVGRTPDKADHLAHYRRVDLCLDTFPYNGTTTTCDALVMGVPVLAIAGEDHRARVGASLLTSAGLDSLIVSDHNGYVTQAVALATDPERLHALRDGLRERVKASPLMDSRRLVERLEAVYRDLWRDWCQHNGPGKQNDGE